ncbi:unnamed protein product [Prunus armeniaca]
MVLPRNRNFIQICKETLSICSKNIDKPTRSKRQYALSFERRDDVWRHGRRQKWRSLKKAIVLERRQKQKTKNVEELEKNTKAMEMEDNCIKEMR